MESSVSTGKANAYQSVAAWTSVTTRDPKRLVVMLYDGALERIALARGCMEHGLAAEKSRLLTRALQILDELRGSLDMTRGGNLAANLDDLYGYMGRRLVEANAGNRVEILDEVSSLLRELRQAWAVLAADPGAAPR